MSPLITIHHFMVGQNPWRIQFQIYMARCSGTHKFHSWESMWGCVQHVACSTRDLSICSNNRVIIKSFLLVNSSTSSGAHLLISSNRANIQFNRVVSTAIISASCVISVSKLTATLDDTLVPIFLYTRSSKDVEETARFECCFVGFGATRRGSGTGFSNLRNHKEIISFEDWTLFLMGTIISSIFTFVLLHL